VSYNSKDIGHLLSFLLASKMHSPQNEWPQGSVTGSTRVFEHKGHLNVSSISGVFKEDLWNLDVLGKCLTEIK